SYAQKDILTSFSDPLAGTSTFTYDQDGLLQRDTSSAGGFQELATTQIPDGTLVTRTTRMGRTSVYQTTDPADGTEHRSVTGPDGLTTNMVEDQDHTKTLSYPDGSRLQLTQAPDPLLGVRALNITGATYTTPSGRQVRTDTAVSYERGADDNPANAKSV